MVLRKSYISLCLAASLMLQPFIGVATPALQEEQTQEQALLQKIAATNVATLPHPEEPSIGDVLDDPYAQMEFLITAIKNPPAYKQRNRAFKILAQAEATANLAPTTSLIIDEQTWNDLNIVAGSAKNPTDYLGSILTNNRTHTELGKAYLYGLLARPTNDTNVLKSRQAIIKELVSNKELLSKLDAVFKDIAQQELFFTGLWDTEFMMQCLSQDYYQLAYIGNSLNESTVALQIKSLYGYAQGIAGQALSITSILAFTTFGALTYSYFFKAPQCLSNYTDHFLGTNGPLFSVLSLFKSQKIKALVALAAGTMSALYLKKSLQYFHSGFRFNDFVRKRLVHISAYTENMRTVLTTVSQIPALKNNLVYFNNINRLLNELPKINAEVASLFTKLQAKTFAPNSLEGTSVFYNYGNVLSAYRLLGKVKQHFESAMTGLGEIEAYMTAAKLINESVDQSAQYCFPTYLEQQKTPAIACNGVWSPFINSQTVVTNTINLGADYQQPNLVVTGPNSAGKSTILKSIALAAIMAQSLGIAPAYEMSLTPFGNIVTYLNVADSQVDQESRFQAEARRVFEYGDKVDQLSKEHSFSFAIFDEIFSGTSPEEGALLGLKVARALARYPTCMSIIATHFPKITELEFDPVTKGAYVNYNVSVEQAPITKALTIEHGKIKRLYKITPGISHQHIAVEVFNEKGITSPFFQQNIGN